MVVISVPPAWPASTVQAFTARPSILTVQAPHWLVSQPTWTPVSRRFWRSRSTRSAFGGASISRASPLTTIDTFMSRASSLPRRLLFGRRPYPPISRQASSAKATATAAIPPQMTSGDAGSRAMERRRHRVAPARARTPRRSRPRFFWPPHRSAAGRSAPACRQPCPPQSRRRRVASPSAANVTRAVPLAKPAAPPLALTASV